MKASEIKALREMLNLSQKEFGEALGVSKNTVYNYESGSPIAKNKLGLIQKLKDDFQKVSGTSDIYLEKNGVRFELVELVDHFMKNKEAYYAESDHIQLYIEKLANKLAISKLKNLGILEGK
jgi:transcriptional regulator with XRE-family HTH domain